jgi:8-oxo-dGTP pyrophosphatase MutT (NUDIX family)
VILDEAGRVLLHRRSDDGLWGMPGGWLDNGETPEQAIVREVAEATGLDVRVVRLAETARRAASVHHTLVCEVLGGELAMSDESLELAYRNLIEVEGWHADHRSRLTQSLGAS